MVLHDTDIIDPNWTTHADVLAAKEAERQADAALAEATRARDECAAWKVSPDPFQQLRHRVEYPALDLEASRCALELGKVQQARQRVDQAALDLVRPIWDQRFREAWQAIEAAATGPLFDAVEAWEQLVASKAAGIEVQCWLPSEWYTEAIRDLVRHHRKELNLDR
jgi:hypothetical protein